MAKQMIKRKDGSFLSFSDNAVVLLSGKGSFEPMATRVFGPIPKDLKFLFQKIVILKLSMLLKQELNL